MRNLYIDVYGVAIMKNLIEEFGIIRGSLVNLIRIISIDMLSNLGMKSND